MAYSKAKLKSNGDRASPCFKPFQIGNMSDKFLPIQTLFGKRKLVSCEDVDLFRSRTIFLEYAIWRVQVKQDGLKLNDTHQLLAHADDVNILGGSIHTVK